MSTIEPASEVESAADKGITYESEYKGKVYYFCCGSCKRRFEKNPEKFTAICWYHI